MNRLLSVILVAGAAVAGFCPGGCGPTINPDFNSAEPAARNAAIIRSVENRDERAVPDLVRMLDSDDAATRLLAINALERLTGTRLGFEYAAPEPKRKEAVARWQERVRGLAAAPRTAAPGETDE